MARPDSSHSASDDASQEGARPLTQRDADLEALLAQWNQSAADQELEAGRAVSRQGIRVRAIVTAGVVLLAAVVMVQTRHSMGWWLEPSAPRELGDLRARFSAGEPAPELASNEHVHVRGLIPTRLIPVTLQGLSTGPTPEDRVENIFYCPLLRAIVVTPQPIVIPDDRLVTVDPAFEPLLRDRLAFPEDLAVTVEVTGRLRRSADGPAALLPFVTRVARRLDLDPSAIWVLEDETHPSQASWAAIVWGLSLLGALLSVVFLIRAYRARRTPLGDRVRAPEPK